MTRARKEYLYARRMKLLLCLVIALDYLRKHYIICELCTLPFHPSLGLNMTKELMFSKNFGINCRSELIRLKRKQLSYNLLRVCPILHLQSHFANLDTVPNSVSEGALRYFLKHYLLYNLLGLFMKQNVN